MEKLRLLLIKPFDHAQDRPGENHPSVLDQSLGARLAALHGPAQELVDLEEDSFDRADPADLEKKVSCWSEKISGVVGATNVAESTRLGEIAEKLNVLCFVANNNVSVWQRRRQVFHIGLPTAQTARAVAELLKRAGVNGVFLLYDETEFQSRVAESMISALEKSAIRGISRPGSETGWIIEARNWKPELVYLIYSEENRALPLARLVKEELPETLLLVGRSLLRSSFIASLGSAAEGILFVDLFRRDKEVAGQEFLFRRALLQEGIDCPTANHGFGWDAMSLCALALSNGDGDPLRAVAYLESPRTIEGVTGRFLFSSENHNGREGFGPTTITRWHNGRIEDAYYL